MPNEIYKFLKENNLTDKDETTFEKEYSSPEKVQELHKFFVDNDLTGKSIGDFSKEHFPNSLKKKVETQSPTPLVSSAYSPQSNQPVPLSPTKSPSPYPNPNIKIQGTEGGENNPILSNNEGTNFKPTYTDFDRSVDQGNLQAETANVLNINELGSKLSKDQIHALAGLEKQKEELGQTEAVKEFMDADGFQNSAAAFAKDPIGVIGGLAIPSMVALVKHGWPRIVSGAGIGAAIGAPTGIGAAAGAATGAISGQVAAGLNLEYSNSIMDSLKESGVNVSDPNELESAFSNDETMDKARSYAIKRGIPIAIVNVIFGGLAGKLAAEPTKALTKKALKGAADLGIQLTGAGTGETLAQLLSTGKVAPKEVLSEMIGELGGGAGEVATGSISHAQQSNQEPIEQQNQSEPIKPLDSSIRDIDTKLEELKAAKPTTPEEINQIAQQEKELTDQRNSLINEIHQPHIDVISELQSQKVDANLHPENSIAQLKAAEYNASIDAKISAQEALAQLQTGISPIQNGNNQNTGSNVPDGGIVETKLPEGLITGNTETTKQEINDSQDNSRVQSNLGGGQEPIQTQPVTSASPQEVGSSGIFQTPEEITINPEEDKIAHEEVNKVYNEISNEAEKLNIDLSHDDLEHISSVYLDYLHSDSPMSMEEAIKLYEDHRDGISNIKYTPEQLAHQYIEEHNNPSVHAHYNSIANVIGKVSDASYKKYGDRKVINNSLAKSYLTSNGKSIDLIAQEASYDLNPDGNGDEITPQDVVDFMDKYPNGANTVKTPSGNGILTDISEKYKEQTGKKLDIKIAKQLVNEQGQTKTGTQETKEEQPKTTEPVQEGGKGQRLDKRLVNDTLLMSDKEFIAKHKADFESELAAKEFWEQNRSSIASMTRSNSKKGANAIGLVGGNNFIMDLFDKAEKILPKFRKEAQKLLTANGFVPTDVFSEWLGTQAKIRAIMKDIQVTSNKLKDNIRDAYDIKLLNKKQVPPEDIILMNKALGGDKKALSELPEKVKESIEDMRAQIDYLSMRMINEGMVDGKLKDKVTESLGSYFTRSYQKWDDPDWVNDIDPVLVNKAKAYISNKYLEAGIDLPQDQLDGIINEIMYSPDAPAAFLKSGKLGSKDISILKKRDNEIAPEIRAIMGEYGDPLLNYSRTIMKQVNLIEKHIFLNKVKDIGMGKFLFDKPNKEHFVQIAGENTQTYSPLNGLYTSPDIKDAFESINSFLDDPEYMKFLLNYIVRPIKVANTVLNNVTHIKNLIGGGFIALRNGHINPAKLSQGSIAFKNLLDLPSEKSLAQLKKYIHLGVIQDDAGIQEFKNVFKDVKSDGDIFQKINEGKLAQTKNLVFDTPIEKIKKLYEAEDNFWKIYTYENELADLKYAYGDSKPNDEIERMAAYNTSQMYPNYDFLPKLVRYAGRIPIFNDFMSFSSEMIRTSFSTLGIAKEQIKSENPKVKALGYKKLAGMALSIMIPTAIAGLSKYANGIDDEEDKAFRDLLAPWDKNGSIIYLTPIENGKSKYINLSTTAPMDLFIKPLNAVFSSQKENLEKYMEDPIKELMSPFFSKSIASQVVEEIQNNRDKNDNKIYSEDDSSLAKIWAMAIHIKDQTIPGALRNFIKLKEAYDKDGTSNKYGKEYSFLLESIRNTTGQNVAAYDAAAGFYFKINDALEDFKFAESKYNKIKSSINESLPKETKANLEKELKDEESKALDLINKTAKRYRNYYLNALKLGVSEVYLKKTLVSHHIPNKWRKSIKTGEKIDKL